MPEEILTPEVRVRLLNKAELLVTEARANIELAARGLIQRTLTGEAEYLMRLLSREKRDIRELQLLFEEAFKEAETRG